MPRPGAKQLVFWIALTVLLVAFDFALSAIERAGPKHLPSGGTLLVLPWWRRIILWLYRPALAACLVTSGTLIRCKRLPLPGRLQPGHWLVLILAAQGILVFITRPVFSLAAGGYLPFGWSGTIWTVGYVVSAVLFVLGAVQLRDAVRWKVLLATGAITSLLWGVPVTLSRLGPSSGRLPSVIAQADMACLPWWLAITAVTALTVPGLDLLHRSRRDWVHWLGTAIWALGSVAAVLTNLHLYTR